MCKVQFIVSNGQLVKSGEQRAVCIQGGMQDTWPVEPITQLALLHHSVGSDDTSL